MAINYKVIVIIIAIIIGISGIVTQYDINNPNQENSLENSGKFFNFNIETKNADLIELQIDSIFKIGGVRDEYIIDGNFQKYGRLYFELDKNNQSLYDELKNTDEKTIVIFPIFTATAYNEPGFYNYYESECDFSCLTVPIKNSLRTEMGGNAVQILKLLNYNFLSDIQIDQNPELLKNYDKVILLHNEYVTKSMFDAITNHDKVIYLYPNALYAEIETNYEENTITLVKGHGFPEEEIKNGYDWEFDNTHPFEFDIECKNWEFYEITNGHMLNCYPELLIFENEELLRKLKEI